MRNVLRSWRAKRRSALSYRPSQSAGRGSNARPPGVVRALYPITAPLRPAAVVRVLGGRVSRSGGGRHPPWVTRTDTLRPAGSSAAVVVSDGRGPQHLFVHVAVVVCSRCGVEPRAREDPSPEITRPLRPATIHETGPPGFEPGPTRLELAVLPVTPRAYRREPPAGVEPAPQPYEGCVLPLTPQRQRWRRRESNPLLLGAGEVLIRMSFIPRGRWPAGFEPTPRGSQPRMLPLHHGHHERGRPDSNRRLLA